MRYDDCETTLTGYHAVSDRDRSSSFVIGGDGSYRELGDGSFVTAHGVDVGASKDLRVSRWSASGERLWTFVLDRSAENGNFAANFRASWIADLSPLHVCAGTMWEGGTQGSCVEYDSGKRIWSGRMPFWAGGAPVGFAGGLYVSDVSGISQRYPFSGVEMRFRKFDGAGGRSSLYLNGEDHMLFSPARAEEPRVIRYDYETLSLVWRLALPADPTPGFGLSRARADVFGVKDEAIAVDPKTGRPLWRRAIPEPRVPIAATDTMLYVLERDETLPNTLHAVDLATGKTKWHAPTPIGTLSVHVLNDRVFLKSVRSVQEVLEPK
ncbi:MAG: PLuB system PQQ-binding repeat protein [bacterium]